MMDLLLTGVNTPDTPLTFLTGLHLLTDFTIFTDVNSPDGPLIFLTGVPHMMDLFLLYLQVMCAHS